MTRLATAVLALALLGGGAAVGDEGRDGPGADAGSEVVADVVRMLQADVDEELIFLWLERREDVHGPLNADDLIALSEAGASRSLIDRLLGPGSPPASRPPAIAESGTAAAGIPVTFSIRYRPFREPESDREDQWHLFVYLDGHPLAWSDGTNWLSKAKQIVEVDSTLTPGRHTVRLLQEKHRRRGDRWFHEARVCPEPIELEASAGLGVEIEIAEPVGLSFKGKRTYRWALLDEGVPRAEREIGARVEDWPPLCEEIEANLANKEKPPRHARKQLERCTSWSDLWPAELGAPSRSVVRERLRAREFRIPAADAEARVSR